MTRAIFLLPVILLGAAPGGAVANPGATTATAPAKLTLSGTLQTGIMAIGGETTGTELNAGGMRYELDFTDPALKKKAEELNAKVVVVTGALTIRQGVERKQRLIFLVDKLEIAPK
jgi:hypothetical protein